MNDLPLHKQYHLVMGGQGDEAMRERIFALLDDPDSELSRVRSYMHEKHNRFLGIHPVLPTFLGDYTRFVKYGFICCLAHLLLSCVFTYYLPNLMIAQVSSSLLVFLLFVFIIVLFKAFGKTTNGDPVYPTVLVRLWFFSILAAQLTTIVVAPVLSWAFSISWWDTYVFIVWYMCCMMIKNLSDQSKRLHRLGGNRWSALPTQVLTLPIIINFGLIMSFFVGVDWWFGLSIGLAIAVYSFTSPYEQHVIYNNERDVIEPKLKIRLASWAISAVGLFAICSFVYPLSPSNVGLFALESLLMGIWFGDTIFTAMIISTLEAVESEDRLRTLRRVWLVWPSFIVTWSCLIGWAVHSILSPFPSIPPALKFVVVALSFFGFLYGFINWLHLMRGQFKPLSSWLVLWQAIVKPFRFYYQTLTSALTLRRAVASSAY